MRILLLCIVLLYSCSERGSLDKPREIKLDPEGSYEIVIIDSCEYISGSHRLTHKGNCKYCKARLRETNYHLYKAIKKNGKYKR